MGTKLIGIYRNVFLEELMVTYRLNSIQSSLTLAFIKESTNDFMYAAPLP
jgi:hypothetical protein